MAVRCQRQIGPEGRVALEARRTEYTAHLGSADAFEGELYWLACRQGERGKEATLFWGDGSPCIWNLADALLPHARKLLDSYHLAQHGTKRPRNSMARGPRRLAGGQRRC